MVLAILGGAAFVGGFGMALSAMTRGVSPLLYSGITLFSVGILSLPFSGAGTCSLRSSANNRHRIMEGNNRGEFMAQIRNAQTLQDLQNLPYYSPKDLERYGVMQQDKATDLYREIAQYAEHTRAVQRYEQSNRHALAGEETRSTLEGTGYQAYTQQKTQQEIMETNFPTKKAEWVAALSSE